MSNKINIITLGDILKNIETEEKAFKFKDYIINLQQENKQLKEDLRVSQSNEETYSLEMQEITKILKEYSGNAEVIFYDTQTKKYAKATGVTISVTDQILNILKTVLGEDSVKLKFTE